MDAQIEHINSPVNTSLNHDTNKLYRIIAYRSSIITVYTIICGTSTLYSGIVGWNTSKNDTCKNRDTNLYILLVIIWIFNVSMMLLQVVLTPFILTLVYKKIYYTQMILFIVQILFKIIGETILLGIVIFNDTVDYCENIYNVGFFMFIISVIISLPLAITTGVIIFIYHGKKC